MNLSLYASATGMEAQQLNLNTIANNIANVNTTGFKKGKIEFQDVLYQNPRPKGGDSGADSGADSFIPTGVEMGHGSQVISNSRIFTQGQLTQTGEKLDLAIEGMGFFQVEKPDGSIAYSRDGGFKVGSDGQVVTNAGYRVLSGFQTIPQNATGITVTENGFVTVHTPEGSNSFQLELARFNNPAGLASLGGNLYDETDASGIAETGSPGADGFGTIHQGFLEMSNVNVVEEMVNMIVAQRAYEINSKAIKTSDEMLSQIARLKT